MSNDDESLSETHDLTAELTDEQQMYSAQYKDGQLHIVEVSPCDKTGEVQNMLEYDPGSILPTTSTDEQPKYLQLDLLNFTVIKSPDGSHTYQMVSSDAVADAGDATITCVLSTDDVNVSADEHDSYVMLEADDDHDPYMYLQSTQQEQATTTTTEIDTEAQSTSALSTDKSKVLTPIEILEKAKALQKAKAFLNSSSTTSASKSKRGRKRKSDLPPPMELLSSPNFKLYLYSCKQCTFKCNAVKEMSAHKKAEHAGRGRVSTACHQCARCPFRGHTHRQLMHHITRTHVEDVPDTNSEYITALQLDSEEVEAADVLVCGACGFESGDRALFKKHIEDEHGAITSVK